ncbi:unnamed protein product [Gongylonema pulchrum]|uniref:Uncharacterized protein n=1 Tax=Gongylonema pulchrum TaxID=637853 RepID=A0A183EFE0_9BILA|nr:unnamed protein product [Gongylonema pulchrum]
MSLVAARLAQLQECTDHWRRGLSRERPEVSREIAGALNGRCSVLVSYQQEHVSQAATRAAAAAARSIEDSTEGCSIGAPSAYNSLNLQPGSMCRSSEWGAELLLPDHSLLSFYGFFLKSLIAANRAAVPLRLYFF